MEIHQSAVILLLVLAASFTAYGQPDDIKPAIKHSFISIWVLICHTGSAFGSSCITAKPPGKRRQLYKYSFTQNNKVMEIHQSAVILLLVLAVSFTAYGQPDDIKPRYQKFLNQHLGPDMTEKKCDSEIRKRGITASGTENGCKEVNTFIKVMEIHQSAVILLLVFAASFTAYGQPHDIKPRYQKSLNQHLGPRVSEHDCDKEIKKRGITASGTGNGCKEVNTFIQANENNIKVVCGRNGGTPQGRNLF
ncbi:ribonuclease-like 3 [Labeo rohita]|uniref:Ribonuclease-like 3 n=1 Tax=Labeo rohita TaxID=84645 RepID=A0A498NWD2_LABRO|nr:ribonuclease-like 3 [Labeo rohita]